MEWVNVSTWKPSIVELADGREVLSDSEEWRAECEARYILNLPNKPARHEQLDKIEKRRGAAARQALEARVMDLWRLTRAKGAA